MTTARFQTPSLPELRTEWREAVQIFWAVVRDRQHGQASQQDVLRAGEAAQRAQDRHREARETVLSGPAVDPRPGDLINRLSIRVKAPELADSTAVWTYVEKLRCEVKDAVREVSVACADFSRPPRALGDLVADAEKAHDRWRTAYDLALHEHPLVGRAEMAGARLGGESRLRMDDWSDPAVGHVRFEAATGAHKLAHVNPEDRERVVVTAISQAVPELETKGLPYLFCARSEGGRLSVDVYLPERHALPLRVGGGERTREAAFLRAFDCQVAAVSPGKGREAAHHTIAAPPEAIDPRRTPGPGMAQREGALPGFEPGRALLAAGRPTLDADRAVSELARSAAAFTTAFSQDPQKVARASRLSVSVGGPAIGAAATIAQIPGNIIRRE